MITYKVKFETRDGEIKEITTNAPDEAHVRRTLRMVYNIKRIIQITVVDL